ncbi:MAG: terminase [Firmicutes bacterium]|nr:terminase [Bacillota bacterium]
MKQKEIIIPYIPRFPELHEALEKFRFCVFVMHRRAGKTVLAINHLIKQALLCDKPFGHFAFVAPFRTQAKSIAWEYVKHYTASLPRTVNESELSITLPSCNGSAKIRLFGADNPDALRGLYYDFVVIDEVSQCKAEVWQEVIRPSLADRDGRCLFIGTPQGPNLFRDLYLLAQKDENTDWFASSYPVTKTNILDPDEIERIKAELGSDAYAREFLCDFNVAAASALIPLASIQEAMEREYPESVWKDSPLIMGVDVGRSNDNSVITFRQGLVVLPQLVYKGLSLTDLCGCIVALYEEKKPAALFVDAIGIGAGVVDRLRELGIPVTDALASARATKMDKFVNRRAESYVELAGWIKAGGKLPDDSLLAEELAAQEYEFTSAGKMFLLKKDRIKEKLGRSPDRADSLALCWFNAAPITTEEYHAGFKFNTEADTAYEPLEY